MPRTFMLLTFIPLLSSLQLACEQNSKAPKTIYGELEADEIDVASRLPARIVKIHVQPGQKVKAGDILVEFEDDVMAVKKKGAQATIAAAESKKAIAHDAVRPEEKAQAQAAVAAAKKQMEFAKSTLTRSENLLKEGAIAQQTLDEIRYKFQAASESYNAAAAKLSMAKTGARNEEKAGADALVEQAKSLLGEVEAYQKDLSLRSPIDGEVMQIMNHEGELVPTGYPVVTLLRMENPWVVINLAESRLKELPMDRQVTVEWPSLPDVKAKGVVSYVAAMGNFATRTFTVDKANFDLKTFEVRISLVDKPAGLRPGMTAIIKPL